MRFFRLIAFVLFIGFLAAVWDFIADNQPAAAETGVRPTDKCKLSDTQNQISVVLLLDASGSLSGEDGSDPMYTRLDGLEAAVRNLANLTTSTGASILLAVDTFATNYERRRGWEDASATLQNVSDLRRTIRPLSGRSTDYGAAMRGVAERFRDEPEGTCNLLLWFTDGEHDTLRTTQDDEWEQLETLCGPGDMAYLQDRDLYSVGVLLSTDNRPVNSDPLSFLFGDESIRSTACENPLEGTIRGDVDASELSDTLKEEISDVVWEVGADGDLPNEESGVPVLDDYERCTGRVGTEESPCVYSFTLDDDIESFRLFLDMTSRYRQISDPSAIKIRVRSPLGNPSTRVVSQDETTAGEYQWVEPFKFRARRPYDNRWEIVGHQAAMQFAEEDWEWAGEWRLEFWGETQEARDDAGKVASSVRKNTVPKPRTDMSLNNEGTLRGSIEHYPSDYSSIEFNLQLRYSDDEWLYPNRPNFECRPNNCSLVPATDNGFSFEVPGLFDEIVWWDSDGGGGYEKLAPGVARRDGLQIVAVLNQQFSYGDTPVRWSRPIDERVELTGLDEHLERLDAWEKLLDAWEELTPGANLLPFGLTLKPAPYEVTGDEVVFVVEASRGYFGGVVELEGVTTQLNSSTPAFDESWSCDVPGTVGEAGSVRTTCSEPIRIDLGLSSDSDVIAVLDFQISRPPDLDQRIFADVEAPSEQDRIVLWREIQQRTQPRDDSADSEEFRVDLATMGDTLAKFLPILLMLIVLAGLLRVLVAWRLRPWNPLGNAEFEMKPLSMDAMDRSIVAAEKSVCMDLTRQAVSARVGDVTLVSSWTPLLLGRPPSIEAVHSGSAGCAGPRASRPGKDHAVGIVGSGLQQGWVVVAHSDTRFDLIVWDLPSELDDQARHVRDVEDAARDAVERLRSNTQTGSEAESAETTQSPSGDSPPRDPFSGTSDPSGGSDDPFRSSDDPFRNSDDDPFNSGF